MLRNRRLTLSWSIRDFSSRASEPIVLGLGRARTSLWQFLLLLMGRKLKMTDWKKSGQGVDLEGLPLISTRTH